MGIGPTGRGGFGLAVALDGYAPNVSRVDAHDLIRRAHALCPYSNATRGNVDVLAYEMARRNARYGLISMSAAGAMAGAFLLTRE